MRFDCAQMENEFLRKRLQQLEERLDSELTSRRELEQQVRGRSRKAASPRCRRVCRFLPPPPTQGGPGEGAHWPLRVFPPPPLSQVLVTWDIENISSPGGYSTPGKNSLCCNEHEHELRMSELEFHFCSDLVEITSHFEPRISHH